MYNFFLLVKRYIFISYFSTFNDFKVNDLLTPAFIIQIYTKINISGKWFEAKSWNYVQRFKFKF